MKLLIFLPGTTQSRCENYALTIGVEARKNFGWELIASFPNNNNTSLMQKYCEALNIEYIPASINDEQEIDKGKKQKALHDNYLKQLKVLHQVKPDVALIAIPNAHIGLSSILACATRRIHSLVTFYNFPTFTTFDDEMTEAMHWCKDRRQLWTTVSENNQYHLSRSLKLRENDITVIKSAPLKHILEHETGNIKYIPEKKEARKSVRSEFGFREDAFIIVSTGSINEAKGFVDFMHITPEILQYFTDVRFIIVGTGELEKEIKNWIKARGFEDQIVLTGHREDIRRILRASDLFMAPSYETGSATALLEAMQEGLPVIASDTNGHKEILKKDKHAYIFPAKNVNKFFEAMKTALGDKEKLKEMGKNCQEKAREFPHEEMIELTMQALQDISGYVNKIKENKLKEITGTDIKEDSKNG
ncbi:MAG: glycosyltransferase family 4 protein [Alphaproteobacteria bacterium]|nr:glycosyltransferase family 4 protein [Alphaproteobacteria bacterium]